MLIVTRDTSLGRGLLQCRTVGVLEGQALQLLNNLVDIRRRWASRRERVGYQGPIREPGTAHICVASRSSLAVLAPQVEP